MSICLLHNVTRKRSLWPSRGIGASVCSSGDIHVTLKRVIYIFKFFPPSGSHTILVLSYQTSWQYSDGDPPNRDIECRWLRWGYEKISSILLHCMLSTLQLLGVINMVPSDLGKLVTLNGGVFVSETCNVCYVEISFYSHLLPHDAMQ